MLYPGLLPANACSFTALIHLLRFLFGYFSPLFLSVSAISRKALDEESHNVTGRTDNTCASYRHGVLFTRATASRDCQPALYFTQYLSALDGALRIPPPPSKRIQAEPVSCLCPCPCSQSSFFFQTQQHLKSSHKISPLY